LLNGLPVATIELKNHFTGQAVKDAMEQYKTKRDPKESNLHPQEDAHIYEQINWKAGPYNAVMRDIAEIQVPENFVFAHEEDTQRIMETLGNPTSGTEIGFFAPDTSDWFIVFEFSDVG
jgi:uncharacterized membrane-anchored protein